MQNGNIADFTVRIRFRIPSFDRIGIDETEVAFTPSAGPDVILKSGDKGTTISQSDWLILQSSGWPTEEDAEAAAEPLMDALRRVLARRFLGADLGRRSPQGGFTLAGLRWLEGKAGRTTLKDTHGPMVFPTELRPMFGRMEVSAVRTVHGDSWKKTFLCALECGSPQSDRERTAFDLLSGAQSIRDSADGRFVLLFAAIETLLEDTPRPKPVVDHVNRLIALTGEADLDKSEKVSLLGTLGWLRSHSIRRSGRRFVRERLGDRKYRDQSAEGFFEDCYEMRNRLLHGRRPFPTYEEVSGLVGELDRMVSNLLAGPILDFDTA